MRLGFLEPPVGLAIIGIAGCGTSPTAPSVPVGRSSPPPIEIDCQATPQLRCTANLFGEGDVTSGAMWSAAESMRLALDVPVTASTAVEFPSPGVIRVVRDQNVYIRADYVSPRWGKMRNIAPHAFAVQPGGVATPLSAVSGDTQLAGVTVEIVDGEGLGKRAESLVNGFYMIEFLRLNRPFTARASKPGYRPQTKTHPGIVDDATGHPSNAYLHFTLSPVT
jgi:hypothetical protein